MKKIAYIAKNLNVNGISSVILSYVTNLNSNDYIFDIYVGTPISDINLKRIKKYKNVRVIKTPNKDRKHFFEYYKFLKEKIYNYDIVHIHGNSHAILFEMIISKKNKNKRIICHCHNITCNNKLLHYILSPFFSYFYDYGIACSELAGKWMFKKKKFTVLKNGVEVDKYKFDNKIRNSIKKELNIKDNEIVIGHVGNFSDQKNYPFLLDLFEKLCDDNTNYKLLLVGEWRNNEEIVNLVNNHKYSSNIILYGASNEIHKLYNVFDLFVFPSKFEGLGIVLLEAQINGLMCFTSNNVPKEVSLTTNIEFLSLENVNLWIDKIKDLNYSFNRSDIINKFRNNIYLYDINYTIKKIAEIYENE